MHGGMNARTAAGADMRRFRAQDEIHDGDIVRCQVPQHVDVGAELPQVEACGVDVEDLADAPPLHDVAQGDHGRVVLKGMAHHEHQTLLIGQARQVERFGRPTGERLFDQHMLAGA